MHENHRISLRENTKRIEDAIRRFLGGRAGEIRSFREERYRSVWEVLQVHPGMFQKETCCRTMIGASELALLFLPKPFFAGPHRDLCPRGKA